jgi:transketolase
VTVPTRFGYDDLHRFMALLVGDEKHAEAASSTLDILWVLYDRILQVTPELAEDRDRFYLSKGHGPMAYYSVLAAKGFIDPAEFERWGSFHSPLGFHPDRVLVPGVEISSGSLGHGLPLAVGTALGLRARGLTAPRVWVLVGDGEMDEGSNHEAVALAGRARLDRLNVVVVDNSSASLGWPGGLEQRFALEGWSTEHVNGRDQDALEKVFSHEHPDRPRAVIADVPGQQPGH